MEPILEMEIYIDKRSQKYRELDLNKDIEICWLLLRSKGQFRLRGTSRIEIGKNTDLHWEKISDKSKSFGVGQIQVNLLSLRKKERNL